MPIEKVTPLMEKAYSFAKIAHEGQTRKYTQDEYLNHPVNVANLVHDYGGTENMICAAFMHDVIEDCGISPDIIETDFNPEVAKLVGWLTDRCYKLDGNRKLRKSMECARYEFAPDEAKIIKMCDILDNTKDIVQYDPSFAKTYLEESMALYSVLADAHMVLQADLHKQLIEAREELPKPNSGVIQ